VGREATFLMQKMSTLKTVWMSTHVKMFIFKDVAGDGLCSAVDLIVRLEFGIGHRDWNVEEWPD